MRAGAALVDGDGLTVMRPSAPPDETRLRALIVTRSDPVGQEDGRLRPVSREQGVPVPVEVARAVDGRLRREVIGQRPDRAANGTGCRGEAALAARPGEEGWPDGFRGGVEVNRRDGRVRLPIVAGRGPAEAARIVGVLDERTRAGVLAIALCHFEAEDGRPILLPREIGQSERLRLRKGAPGPPRRDTWLDREICAPGTPARGGAEIRLDVCRGQGDGVEVTRRQESLALMLRRARGGAARPAHLRKTGTCSFDAMRAREPRRDVFGSEGARLAVFERCREAFPNLSPDSPRGRPAFPLSGLLAPATEAAFGRLSRERGAGWQEGVA